MNGLTHVSDAVAPREQTLAALLTEYARTAVPARLYILLQFGIPFALDFGLHGWHRTAALGVAIASSGGWGLADRWLFERPSTRSLGTTLMRAARLGAGILAATIPAVLLIQLFLHLLGRSPIS
jgi:hypothetical protein